MRFGPDGNLYVRNASFFADTSNVLRYDGKTGAFIDVFVPSVSGLAGGVGDLLFGPDGKLYVAVLSANVVRRYNGLTGAFIDDFASGGGLSSPFGLAFGPDGNLYVASSGTEAVLRYSGRTGAFLDTFAGVTNPVPTYLLFAGLATEPDADGDGVPDSRDLCPNTPKGDVVDADGCSIDQLCPCRGSWKNHGEFVDCVASQASRFFDLGLITETERRVLV